MDKNIINKIESKLKAMSFSKLILMSFIIGGAGSLVFVITRDILNMFI